MTMRAMRQNGIKCAFSGGLGNHMFQYAYARLVSEIKEVPYKFESSLIRKYFNTSMESETCAENYELLNDGYPYYQNTEQLSLLKENLGTVRSWFKPSDTGKYFLEKLNFPSVINVRGNDFISLDWCPEKKYYDDVVKQLRTDFIVITDDPAYAKAVLSGFRVFHTDDDFSILYYSKNLICSFSSYCWWAAFLGQHELIVSPSNSWGKKNQSPIYEWAVKNMGWRHVGQDGSIC